MSWWGFKPYVSVAQRRANAAKEMAKLKKKGRVITPVKPEGRAIATTFWGKAWCDNLESYSDFANRLPRGRTYVRNGSVCDLQIEPGRVTALVCGSELYRIAIKIKPLPEATWRAVKSECAGRIGSLVELLQGRMSKSVMEIVTRRDGGLFPKPKEIDLDCSCPDWADMCKHVAAALYGVGTRLDEQPELLFVLRKVDHLELIAAADGAPAGAAAPAARGKKTLAADELADVFGIELEPPPPGTVAPAGRPAKSAEPKARKRGSAEGKRSSKKKIVPVEPEPAPAPAPGRRAGRPRTPSMSS